MEIFKMRIPFEFWVSQGKTNPAACVQAGRSLTTESVKLNERSNQLEMVKQSAKRGKP